MAPRKKYSNACIAEAVAKSVVYAKSKLPNAIAIQHLSCEHLVDASSADVKRNAPVKFRWRIQHGVYDAAAEVEVLCHNVVNKGVPLPEHWHTAMQFLALPDIATSSARKVCFAMPDLRMCAVCFWTKQLQNSDLMTGWVNRSP